MMSRLLRVFWGSALICALAHAGCDQTTMGSPAGQIWTRQLGSTQDDSLAAISATSGSLYAAGSTSGKLAGYTGNTNPPDGLVVKLDLSGQVTWQKQFGTLGADEWRGVAADASGAVYVVGYTSSAFDGQTRVGGNTDAVIARIDSTGNLTWVRQFGTDGDDYLLGVVVDGAGNAYAAGWTSGTFAGQTLRGPSDGIVVKYHPDGTQEWLVQFGSPQSDSLNAIAIDGSGTLYLAGWATDAVVAGQTALGGRDAVVYKFQPGSGLSWGRQIGTSADDEAAAVAVDSSTVYIAGRTLGTLGGQVAGGRVDGFVASFDLGGGAGWQRQIGTLGDDEMHSLAVDASGGGVYVGGYVSRALPGVDTWLGQEDAVFLKMRSDGEQLWVNQFGTSGNDQLLGLFSPGPGVLFVAGSVQGALPTQTQVGMLDGFLGRYSVP